MSATRWRLILNGKSAADEAVREAVQQMRGHGQALQVRVTWEAGDAQRYVNEAIADGVDVIVAAGGDGTLGEVAHALAETDLAAGQLPSLGLLPLGTANDFASASGLAEAPLDALQLIARTAPIAIDVLRVQGDGSHRWCANVASGGFGTEVTVETHEGLKKMLGGLAYVVTGVARLGRIEPIRARIESADLHWQGGFIALGIGNGRQAGGGQVLCPDALINDGLLDLTIIPELSGEFTATLATLLSEGRHAALEQVAVRSRLASLEIVAETPMTLNLDGEPLQSRYFRVDCVAARLRMHLPQPSPLLSG
jgi:lipid kinase YegS